MDDFQARKIIGDTFEKTFDKQRFAQFINNFLNHFEKDTFIHRGYNIPDSYNEYISSWERLGKYSDGENRIDILIVNLKKETSLERARSRQRNFVAGYLQGKYGRTGEKEAALVAYVSPDKKDWRFSLVKMDYKFEKTVTGRIKVKEEFTPSRRWSFLVGVNEKSHTAKSRLIKILANEEQDPTLKEIENAFDIETVTKEFFIKYRELFMRTKEELDKVVKNDPKIKIDFEANGVDTVNFAKKLLGQIVFLYFLQKKGWFGVGRDDEWGTGSKQFLRELFDKKHGDYKNFFNDILEHLFYDALRNDRSHNDCYFSQLNCKIPFLNGGLFDPIGNYDWVHTDIIIPDKLFSNNINTKEGDTGTGILDVFDRYNFTVKEDEPLEKEVAIDPELLGKAYEKFNAIRPDNYDEFKKALKSGKKGDENKFNRKFGVYYTPREIVHYMCQQSLINYIATQISDCDSSESGSQGIHKEDIETLIHTGEHVSENDMAALTKAEKIKQGKQKTSGYKLQLPESIRNNAALIDEKLSDITVCDPAVGSGAFLVGMMNEIVKIRNVLTPFLSLQGAQTTNQSQIDENRSPYNFKRRCIEHSLYGVDIDPGAVEIAKLRLWLSLIVDEENIKNIKPLPNLDYKVVRGNSLIGFPENWNSPIANEIEELKQEYFSETNPSKKIKLKQNIDAKLNRRYEKSMQIFGYKIDFDFRMMFSEVFYEKGGFDVVIANPPYGVKFSSNEKKYLKKRYEHIVERICNSFLYFLGLAYELSKERGIVSYIIPNEFLFQIYMTKARTHFLNYSHFLYAFNIGEEVFEAVVPTCLIAIKKEQVGVYNIPVADFRNMSLNELDKKLKEGVFINTSKDMVLKTVNSIFSFNKRNTLFVNKLIERYQPFDDFCDNVSNGISTSCDDVYIVSKELSLKKHFESLYLKPCIRGGQFNRYFCPSDTGDRLLYITKEFSKKDGSNIMNYLKEYRKLLVKKCVEKNTGTRAWYILFRARDDNLFKIPKMLFRQTGDSIIACLDEKVNYYGIDSVNIAILKNSFIEQRRYFLGVLNSKIIDFIYKNISQEAGRVLSQVKPQRIRALPIVMPRIEKRKPIEEIVERIHCITKDEDYLQNPQKKAKVESLEAEIDELVYKLYELTPKEIEIVKGNIKE